MSELSLALSNPGTGAAIAAFAKTALVTTVAAVAAPEIASIVLVGGAYLAVGAAYYAWKNSQTKAIQDKALAKHLQGEYQSGLYDVRIRFRGVFGEFVEDTVPKYGGYIASGINAEEYLHHFNRNATPPQEMRYLPVQKIISDGKIVPHLNDPSWFSGIIEPITILEQASTSWENLTDAQRKAAVDLLTDDDWKDVVGTMVADGTLQPGQTLPNDVMTLGNAQVQPSGSRVLSAEQQAIREAIKPELDQLNSDMAKNAAAIAAIAGTLGLVNTLTGNIDKNVANLGNTATQTKQAVDNVASKVDAAKNEMNDNFNKVKRRLSGIASFINFDRILNIMIWWQTLHNCFMLSADLGRSLTSGISTVLKALPGDSLVGLPTEAEDGAPLDLGTKINQLFETAVKSAIGVDNYVKMQVELVKINRVYQSIANGVFMIQGGIQSLQNVTELTGERVGKVGNSLKRFRVVGEKAYEHFSENLNTRTSWFAKFENAVNAGQEVTSTVEQIASEVISVQDAFTQLKGQKDEFDKSLEDLTASKRTDNKEAKEASEKAKAASESPSISQADQRKPEAA